MPLIRVTSGGQPLTDDQRQRLAVELTDVLLEIEGGSRSDRARSLAYVMFEHLDDWAIGGTFGTSHHTAPTRLMARVDVPYGALDQKSKARAIRATYQAMATNVPGAVFDDGWAPWVIITEVREGQWGGSGQPRGLADIAEHAGVADDAVTYLRSQDFSTQGT